MLSLCSCSAESFAWFDMPHGKIIPDILLLLNTVNVYGAPYHSIYDQGCSTWTVTFGLGSMGWREVGVGGGSRCEPDPLKTGKRRLGAQPCARVFPARSLTKKHEHKLKLLQTYTFPLPQRFHVICPTLYSTACPHCNEICTLYQVM